MSKRILMVYDVKLKNNSQTPKKHNNYKTESIHIAMEYGQLTRPEAS